MKWNAWGDPQHAKPLSEGIRALLTQALGVTGSSKAELDADQVRLRPSELAADHREALAAIVGPDHVRVETETACCAPAVSPRWTCCAARTPALKTRLTGFCCQAPMPRWPRSCVLLATRHRRRPFGGGTSVVGGLDPIRGDFAAAVSLDLRRFDELVAFDEVSGEAEFGAGVTGPQAEELLSAQGFSLGHFPQISNSQHRRFRRDPLGGAGLGGLRTVRRDDSRAAGDHTRRGAGPRPGTAVGGGPGSAAAGNRVGGRVRRHHQGAGPGPPGAEATRYEAWSFPDFATGAAALRTVTQTGTGPTVIRLSDEAETGVNLATTESIGDTQVAGGCLAITVFEGTQAHAESRHAKTRALMTAQGGTSLGESPPEPGSADDSARHTCATHCWPTARSARPSRRPPTGRTSPR